MSVLAKDADTGQDPGRDGSRSTSSDRVDLASLPLEQGDPATVGQALADALFEQMRDTYLAMVDNLLGADGGEGDPFTLEAEQWLRDRAETLARGRLAQYQERLGQLLASEPDDETLPEWLAHRALSDAAVWARLDTLAIGRQARKDYYARNPPVGGRWTILPEGAAEPGCQEVAGRVYDSYDEAEAALDSVWHPNCVHYVDRADVTRQGPDGAQIARENTGDHRPASDDGGDDGAEVRNGEAGRFTSSGRLLTPALKAARAAEDGIRGDQRETGILIDRFGHEVLRRQGERDAVPIYTSERDLLRGGTFTHNHPADTAFSLEDVTDIAAWGNLGEIRIVGPTSRYSLRPGRRGWPAPAALRAAFRRATRLAQREAARQVWQGKLPVMQAAAAARHLTWVRLAEEFGLLYEREE